MWGKALYTGDGRRRHSLNMEGEGRLRAGLAGEEEAGVGSGQRALPVLKVSVALTWGQEPPKVLSKGMT